VVNGTVYVGSLDGSVHAIDAGSGTEEWSVGTNRQVRRSLAVANGTVYAGCADNNLYALDAGNSLEQWTFPTGGSVSAPAVANGTVYVGS